MNRLEYWVTDADVLELYKSYLTELIDCGCFEGAEIDVDLVVDNLYVNYTAVKDSERLINEYGIEVDDCDRILASDKDNDLYLISTY